jgi:hypothetical protein
VYLKKIASLFTGSSKAYVCALMSDFVNTKYNGSGFHDNEVSIEGV